MREPLKDRVRLEHILTAIDNIFQFTEGKTIEQFNDSTMLFYATVKNIEIIGEAAYHLTRAFCKEHPETPWKDVMLMRNILVHDYYKIRLNEVWKVIKEDLLPLREQVDRYIAETNWEEWEKNEVVVVESAVHKNMVQTARRMKQRGYDTDEICKITGLPREEIEEL